MHNNEQNMQLVTIDVDQGADQHTIACASQVAATAKDYELT